MGHGFVSLMSAQKNLLDIILDTLETIERYRHDASATPTAVLDAMHARACLMLKKMISTPTCTSYCIFNPALQSASSAPVAADEEMEG